MKYIQCNIENLKLISHWVSILPASCVILKKVERKQQI